MVDVSIKKVTLADVNELQWIGRQTFIDAYAHQNTERNMQQYLNESFTVEQLTKEVSKPESEFYFATIDNKIIGYLKLNYGEAQTELQNQNALEIERIYVLQAFQGQKVGSLLYQMALKVAKKREADFLWLGVWEKNPGAIQFYRKMGFVAFDKHIFPFGDEQQTDIMMKLEIA